MVEGGAVNLTCVAVGSPMPYVRWRRGSVDVPSVAGQMDAPTPIGKNVLQLTDVLQTVTYTCIASSELGSIEHHAEVRVRGTRIGFLSTRPQVISAADKPNPSTNLNLSLTLTLTSSLTS